MFRRGCAVIIAILAGCGGDGSRVGDPACRLSGGLTYQWTGEGGPDKKVHSLVPPDLYAESPPASEGSCRATLAACTKNSASITPKNVMDVRAAEDVEAAWPGTTGGVRKFLRAGPAKPELSVSELGRGTLVFTSTCPPTDECLPQTTGLETFEALLEQVTQAYGPACK